jgi:hypothetical protein
MPSHREEDASAEFWDLDPRRSVYGPHRILCSTMLGLKGSRRSSAGYPVWMGVPVLRARSWSERSWTGSSGPCLGRKKFEMCPMWGANVFLLSRSLDLLLRPQRGAFLSWYSGLIMLRFAEPSVISAATFGSSLAAAGVARRGCWGLWPQQSPKNRKGNS